jgi:hypothetical protein
MPAPTAKPSIYQLKITLLGIERPIWRCIQVPSTMLLCCLHDAFQAVMGWTDRGVSLSYDNMPCPPDVPV